MPTVKVTNEDTQKTKIFPAKDWSNFLCDIQTLFEINKGVVEVYYYDNSETRDKIDVSSEIEWNLLLETNNEKHKEMRFYVRSLGNHNTRANRTTPDRRINRVLIESSNPSKENVFLQKDEDTEEEGGEEEAGKEEEILASKTKKQATPLKGIVRRTIVTTTTVTTKKMPRSHRVDKENIETETTSGSKNDGSTKTSEEASIEEGKKQTTTPQKKQREKKERKRAEKSQSPRSSPPAKKQKRNENKDSIKSFSASLSPSPPSSSNEGDSGGEEGGKKKERKHTDRVLNGVIDTRRKQERMVDILKYRMKDNVHQSLIYRADLLDYLDHNPYTKEQYETMVAYHPCLYSSHRTVPKTRRDVPILFENAESLKNEAYVRKHFRLMPPNSPAALKCYKMGCVDVNHVKRECNKQEKRDYLKGKIVYDHEETPESIQKRIDEIVDSIFLPANRDCTSVTTLSSYQEGGEEEKKEATVKEEQEDNVVTTTPEDKTPNRKDKPDDKIETTEEEKESIPSLHEQPPLEKNKTKQNKTDSRKRSKHEK